MKLGLVTDGKGESHVVDSETGERVDRVIGFQLGWDQGGLETLTVKVYVPMVNVPIQRRVRAWDGTPIIVMPR